MHDGLIECTAYCAPAGGSCGLAALLLCWRRTPCGLISKRERGHLDYDIVVVGAGPAGLSAAARAAWLATPGATYKARIVVLDAGSPPGGLSRWQPLVVNSP